PGHGPRFWELLEAYPRTERARGYLEGVVAADAGVLRPTAPSVRRTPGCRASLRPAGAGSGRARARRRPGEGRGR
ncbi:hypothetical protein ACWC98_26915, partial [Streptomyces goshikiensis]